MLLNQRYFPNETTKFHSLSESVWLSSLITCHSSLEVFRSPEVVHFIHKKYIRAFPMKSKDADWATRHYFDVIMSGALQAKSLGWLSLIIIPLDSQCIPMQLVLPSADRGSFSYICTASMGQVCAVRGSGLICSFFFGNSRQAFWKWLGAVDFPFLGDSVWLEVGLWKWLRKERSYK